MKRCPKCNAEKPKSEFGKNKSRYDGLQGNCKTCRNEYLGKWYQDNKEIQKQRVAKTKPARQKEIKLKLIEYYDSHPCVDCGESDWQVLESDHIGEKTLDICKMFLRGFSWDSIQEELKQCETRCANCHKRKTTKQFGYYKYLD